MLLGRAAANRYRTYEEASSMVDAYVMTLNLFESIARARETGCARGFPEFAEKARDLGPDAARRSQQLGEAFGMLRLLGRVKKKSRQLDLLEIRAAAPKSVLRYMEEGSRCWLFGLNGATVALARACVEEALRTKLNSGDRLELKLLIIEARPILDAALYDAADLVRRMGNRYLHGEEISDQDARVALDTARLLADHLFRDK